MKKITIAAAFLLASAACSYAQTTPPPIQLETARSEVNTIHSFKVEGLEGGEIDFSAFAGKKILVVNTASKCGLAPQFEGLDEHQGLQLYRLLEPHFDPPERSEARRVIAELLGDELVA